MLQQPFRTIPFLPLASVACLTTVCPTADCHPTMAFHPTMEFHPMPTQACPALPTTPLPLPLQRRKRSRQNCGDQLFTNVPPSIVGVY